MPDEQLTLILKLRDEATKQLKSARAGIIAAGAAIGAAGFTAGKKWDDATKTIVAGTGATGEALAGLQDDYQAVAKYGDGAATAIADLNTHLELQGDELQMVAEAALKAKADTNLFGDVAAQLGLDAKGAAAFLDDLTASAQGSGVDIDVLTRTIGRSAARWQAAGGDMKGLTATVIQAADEFGPSGLRGAMSEILQEVDKGLLPSITSLEKQLGDTTGAVERTYAAGKTWRDTLREMKDGALAYIGPGGDMIGAIGSAASGLALAGPQMLTWIKGLKLATIAQRAFNLAMRLNPIGLVVTALVLAGAAIWKFRDEIKDGFGQVVAFAQNLYLGVKEWMSDKLGAIFDGVKAKVDAVTGFFKTMKDKVVGNSIIPDMVNQIGGEFTRMGGLMTSQMSDATNKMINIFTSAFTSGGGFIGAIKGVATQAVGAVAKLFLTPLASALSSGLKGIFAGGGSVLASTGLSLGAGTGAAAGAGGGIGIGGLIGAIPGWGWAAAGIAAAALFFKGWGGPSKAEKEAREIFGGFHAGVVDALGGTQRFAEEVQLAIDQGWDRTLAESRAGFIIWGQAAGKTYDEAFNDYSRYERAVREGNTSLMRQINRDYAGLRAQAASLPGRAAGGPVSGGSPYVVGERGPEIFVPSSSGSVAANKSLPTAEEIGAAVAAAMQRAPLVVPQDPVTDALYRNGPRRAALKGYA